MPFDGLPDQQLVRLTCTGEREAFAEIVRRYQAFVVRTAMRVVRDLPAAEDVAQEVFLRAYRALGNFRPDMPVAPWLRRITINQALTHVSQRRRNAALPLESARDVPIMAADASENVAGEQLAAAVRELAHTLPESYQEILRLRAECDMNYTDIAVRTGKPLGTVKSYLLRARRLLRVQLEAAGVTA